MQSKTYILVLKNATCLGENQNQNNYFKVTFTLKRKNI